MKKISAMAATFVFLIAVLGSSGLYAAKTANSVAAVATFSNRIMDLVTITDNIYSDGAGLYSDATIGAGTFSEVSIGTGAYGDFLLRLYRSPRFLTFDYSDRVTGAGLTDLVDDYDVYFKVYNITTMHCGEFLPRLLAIDNTAGKVRFDDTDGSTRAHVTRVNANTWTVTTDGGYETARLVKSIKGKLVTVGLYRMPFEMTIVSSGFTCPL